MKRYVIYIDRIEEVIFNEFNFKTVSTKIIFRIKSWKVAPEIFVHYDIIY